MAERPIIFSGPMVRAILEGRKTQTRRALKPKRGLTVLDVVEHGEPVGDFFRCTSEQVSGPSYSVGDTLWVRERIRRFYKGTCDQRVQYHADGSWNFDHPGPAPLDDSAGYNVPPILMPRWASRITLKVTGVKVQRLQNISANDCRAEGHPVDWSRSPNRQVHDDAARDWFRDTWQSINGPSSWDANPWVAAISFERVK